MLKILRGIPLPYVYSLNSTYSWVETTAHPLEVSCGALKQSSLKTCLGFVKVEPYLCIL